jgi:hypothetical protein
MGPLRANVFQVVRFLANVFGAFISSGNSVSSTRESCVANNSNLNCRQSGSSWTCNALEPFSDRLRVLSKQAYWRSGLREQLFLDDPLE